jgi:carbon monoxide dehydrogenase subunit G
VIKVPGFVRDGWKVSFETSEVAEAPPAVVWALITDWERQDDWMLEASDFTVTSSEREGVGVEAEATIGIGGIRTRDRVRVSGWEPNRRLAIEHRGWVTGHGEIVLTQLPGDRTHIRWREELEPPLGLAGALGMTGFRPLMKRIFRRDLRVLATLARTTAHPRGTSPP